jgi:transposase
MNKFTENRRLTAIVAHEIPLTVKEAANYLGVSPQTVYLWAERKQIGLEHDSGCLSS